MPKEQYMFNEKPQEQRDRIAQDIHKLRDGETMPSRFNPNYEIKRPKELIQAEKWYGEYNSADFFHNVARQKIISGEVENLEEANKIVSKEIAELFANKIFTDDQWTIDIPSKGRNAFREYFKDQFRNSDLEHDSDNFDEDNFFYQTGIGFALSYLPYEEAHAYASKFIENAEKFNNGEAPRLYSQDIQENIALAFLKLQCDDSEKLEKFLSSDLIEFTKPDSIIDQAAKKKMGIEVIKPLIDKYGIPAISQLDLFSENGVLSNVEKSEKEKFLKQVLEDLDTKADKKIQEIQEYNADVRKRSYGWDARDLKYLSIKDGYVEDKLSHIENAMKEGIFPENYQEVFSKIQFCIDESAKHPSANYAGERSRRDDLNAKLSKLQIEAELHTGKDFGIEGKGIELMDNHLFSDGKLVAVLENATFGDKYTNGEIISWKRTEKLDSEIVLGNQIKLSIWGYKKGDNKPSELYDTNYWSAGKYVNVSNPEVSDDGIINFTVEKEGGAKETIKKSVS